MNMEKKIQTVINECDKTEAKVVIGCLQRNQFLLDSSVTDIRKIQRALKDTLEMHGLLHEKIDAVCSLWNSESDVTKEFISAMNALVSEHGSFKEAG